MFWHDWKNVDWNVIVPLKQTKHKNSKQTDKQNKQTNKHTIFRLPAYLFQTINSSVHMWTFLMDYTMSRAFLMGPEQLCPWTVWKDSWLSFVSKNVDSLAFISRLFLLDKVDALFRIFASASRRIFRGFSELVPGYAKFYVINFIFI